MLQDTSITDARHEKFIERIVETEIVWALESSEGWASSGSNDFEETDVIPFWSDRTYAEAVAKEDWAHFTPTTITLTEFLENWLIGMTNDGTLVGTNWDVNLFGKESEPLLVAVEIIDALKAKDKQIELIKFTDLTDYESEIRQALDKSDHAPADDES